MKIDFYILDSTNTMQAWHFACGLVEKAYAAKEQVYLHTSSREEAARLDSLLWTYREDSFLPHCLYTEKNECAAPIYIGFGSVPKEPFPVLINLSQERPELSAPIKQLIEIVFADPLVQQLARDRYRYYREQGHDLNTHKIKMN